MDKLNLDLAAGDAPADIAPPVLADRMLHAALGHHLPERCPQPETLMQNALIDLRGKRGLRNVEYVDAGRHVTG